MFSKNSAFLIVSLMAFLFSLSTTNGICKEVAQYQVFSERNWHGLAIKSGTLWAWGRNNHGQIGDGTTVDKHTPVQIGSDNRWKIVSAGGTHNLAIKSDGTLWAWGQNDHGQLGDGTTVEKHTPVRIGSDNDWYQISAGGAHSLGIRGELGYVYAWGANYYGQIGDGTKEDRQTPVCVFGFASMVAAGSDTSFAINAGSSASSYPNGLIWAWGYNHYGQLGDGTIGNHDRPTYIDAGGDWVTISAAGLSTFAIRSDGTLWAWGRNSQYQLGDGTMTDRLTPVQTGSGFIRVSAASISGLALKADGTLWGWGNNTYGQLGDGTRERRDTPVQVGSEYRWVTISAGAFHSLAIKSDGTLWAWGRNTYGQVGDGTTVDKQTPVQIGSDNRWKIVSAGGTHNLAIKSDGTLWAWGRNNHGQLGDGILWAYRTAPFQVGAYNDWVNVSAGYEHSLALKLDGTMWTWGFNGNGQLGNGTTTDVHYPYKLEGEPRGIKVSAGYWHSFMIRVLWFSGCGRNDFGQIGDGTDTEQHSLGYGIDFMLAVSAGGLHSLGVKPNGTLWAWGRNSQYQLGDGTQTTRLSPVYILNTGVAASGGDSHSLALKSDGTLWAWGANESGQVGDDTWLTKTIPVQVGSDDKWVDISAGRYHSLALKSNGTIWAWGNNNYGQLGFGNEINQNTPKAVQLYPPCSQCNRDTVELTNVEFPEDTVCECRAGTQITIGNGTTVKNKATVYFIAPKVTVKSGATFENGAVVRIKQ